MEVSRKMPGVKDGSLAQGGRRLWLIAAEREELKELVVRMMDECQ